MTKSVGGVLMVSLGRRHTKGALGPRLQGRLQGQEWLLGLRLLGFLGMGPALTECQSHVAADLSD